MKNKTFLLLILAATLTSLGGLITLVFTNLKKGNLYFDYGLSAVNVLGFMLLIKNSSITRLVYFRYISFLIVVIIIGSMFKIMHWPGNSILLSIGLLGVPIIYTIHFIKKPIKQLLDNMKLVWVITVYLTTLGVIVHWLPSDVTYLPNIIMLLTILQFASLCIKNKALLES